MAVIDLNSGKVTGQLPDIAAQVPQPEPQRVGGIIDLDTGKFLQDLPEPQQAEQPIQQAQPISQLAPQAIEAATQAVQSIAAPDTGIADFFTGSERIEATPELGTLPEFGSTPGSAKTIAMFTTFDEKAQKEIIAEAIPEATFETTTDGSTIITAPGRDGELVRSVLNRPGLSPQDAATIFTQFVAFLPSAKLANLGKTLLKKVGIGGAAAGATEQALQEVGIEAGRKERDPVSTAIATLTGGLAEAALPAIQAVRQGRQAAKVGAERADIESVRKAIEPAQEAIKALDEVTGVKVGLFPAQQTRVPSELLKQRVLPQLDAGAKQAAEALSKQNKEVFDATAEMVNLIAPEGKIIGGARRFKAVAEKAIKNAKKVRSQIVKPLYDAAFQRSRELGSKIDLDPVTDFINAELKNLVSDDPAAVALNSFLKRLQGEKIADTPKGLIVDKSGASLIPKVKGGTEPLTLEQLQSAKFTTDSQIDKMGGITPGPATKNAKRLLTQAEKLYRDQLGKLSPEFKAANEKFASLSPAIDDLENSLIGEVVKIPDDKVRNVSTTIFNPKEEATNPTAIRQARNIINQTDPNAWNDILRVEINRRLGGITQLAEDFPELIGNEPGQIRRALFGNPAQRDALMAGFSKEQKKNFTYLEGVLRRAESGRAAGSPTAAFGQAIEKLKGVGVVLRDALFRPLQTLQQTGESSIFDSNVRALTKVMFDPDFQPKMAKLRKLNPDSPAAARALTQLLNDIEIIEE